MMVYIPKGVPLAWISGPKALPPGPVYAATRMEAGPDDNVTYAEYCNHFHKQEGTMKKRIEKNTGIIVAQDGSIYLFRDPAITVTNQHGCFPQISIEAALASKFTNAAALMYDVVPEYLLTVSEPEHEKKSAPFVWSYDKNPPFPLANKYAVSRILKSGPVTIVFWKDGTKTLVRRAPDEEDNDYAAFTAALAIKMYGSNSALKRMLKEKVEVQKPKKKSTECTDTCPIDYDQIERDLAAANSAKTVQEATEHITMALIGNAE